MYAPYHKLLCQICVPNIISLVGYLIKPIRCDNFYFRGQILEQVAKQSNKRSVPE